MLVAGVCRWPIHDKRMASQLRESARFDWTANLRAGASRQSYTATLPSDRFHCLLDELPLHLIPQSFRSSDRRENPDRDYHLNPDCSILPAGEIPTELEVYRHLLRGFSLQNTVAWVRDAGAGWWQPFWLAPPLEAMASGVSADSAAPISFAERATLLLVRAGILTCAEHSQRRLEKRAEIVNAAAKMFREKGYAPLSGLIHPFNLAALRRYYRQAIRRGKFRLGDQTARRYVAHNEPVARFFHYQLVNTVSTVVGESIKPSYTYMASYLGGAELAKHTDREQCEFSVSLCLDFSPEPELETPWPIHLETSRGQATVYQALGDALLYRGTGVAHYRRPLSAAQTSTSLLFHYVPRRFAGSLD